MHTVAAPAPSLSASQVCDVGQSPMPAPQAGAQKLSPSFSTPVPPEPSRSGRPLRRRRFGCRQNRRSPRRRSRICSLRRLCRPCRSRLPGRRRRRWRHWRRHFRCRWLLRRRHRLRPCRRCLRRCRLRRRRQRRYRRCRPRRCRPRRRRRRCPRRRRRPCHRQRSCRRLRRRVHRRRPSRRCPARAHRCKRSQPRKPRPEPRATIEMSKTCAYRLPLLATNSAVAARNVEIVPESGKG
jgi:hypothetical protein